MFHSGRTLRSTFLAAATLLLAGSATAGDSVSYECSGSFQGYSLTGCVQFQDSSSMDGSFSAKRGAPTAPGVMISFNGSYTELDLLLISFWRFEDTDVDGSGIRLLFGLFVFGSVRVPVKGGGTTPLSFRGVVGSLPDVHGMQRSRVLRAAA